MSVQDSPNPAAIPQRSLLSVVVPCFDEHEVLLEFHRRLAATMDGIGEPWDVLYINDGSRDRTLSVMQNLAAQDPRVGWLNLSRNFGKEAALTAGLDHALGSGGIVVIDADLQDPPEVIPDLVAAWRGGIDMAYAKRRRREGDSPMKRLTASLFYRLMSRVDHRVMIPEDSGDFRLISRRALDALLELREQHRFMKGLFAWVGFSSQEVLYDRAPRAAGSSKWNYWSLWNFALEGLTGFSVLPLKLSTYVGLFTAVGALLFGLQLIARTMLYGNPVSGYPSLMAVVLFLGGVQLISLGVIGEYLGRIANESKRRPLYVVEKFAPPDCFLSTADGVSNARSVPSGRS